jgi:hypothetical protein
MCTSLIQNFIHLRQIWKLQIEIHLAPDWSVFHCTVVVTKPTVSKNVVRRTSIPTFI